MQMGSVYQVTQEVISTLSTTLTTVSISTRNLARIMQVVLPTLRLVLVLETTLFLTTTHSKIQTIWNNSVGV